MTSQAGGGPSRLVLSQNKRLRLIVMTVFYFAQGLPIGLFLTAIAAWLAYNGASEGDVAAVIAFTFLPWSFKFFGAALMDRYTYLPMGRRRIWLIGAQGLMLVGLAIAAVVGPGVQQAALIGWLGFIIFCGSAMQDVAIDGMAVDILPDDEQGPASAFMFGGQALGIAGGAAGGGLLLASFGTTVTFLAFMPVIGAILVLAIVMRERPGEKIAPWTKGQSSPVSLAAHGTPWLRILAITLKSMIKRDSVIYLLSVAGARTVAGAFTAFWPVFATTEAGFDTSGYSSMIAIVGLIGSVACMVIGSVLNMTLGPKRASMLVFLGYALISLVYLVSPDLAAIGYFFVALSLVWNMTDTLGSVCTNPLRMRLSDKRVAATQFTIYNSMGNLPVPIGASIFAWASGAGGLTLLMPILIALVAFAILAMAMMRIGKVVDDKESLAPRLE